MTQRVLFTIAALAALLAPAHAQRLELEAGVGYVLGGGAENPGPSLPTIDGAVVVWPWAAWGMAVRLVKGPGEDLHEPIVSGDRTFLGQGHLQYWTVTVRRRIAVGDGRAVELGFGQLFGGRFATVQEFHQPPRRVASRDTFFSGFALEGLFMHTLARRLAVKGGVTFDFNVETTNLQPSRSLFFGSEVPRRSL